tara:strand:+ start:2750 stop:3721 length:972 start_codon:yes stop_codon:yes gene_type:complete
MASKKFAYYNKGNKIGIIQQDTSDATSDDYTKYKSPIENIESGIEIEYSYAPTFNINNTGLSGTDFHRFSGWGSDGTNLLLFASGLTGIADLTGLFSADDYIYVEGSGTWSGLHQVKSVGLLDKGILTLKTRANLKGSIINPTTVITGRSGDTPGNISGSVDAQDKIIDEFKDLTSTKNPKYIFTSNASNGANNGLFRVTYSDTKGNIQIDSKITNSVHGDYVDSVDSLTTEGAGTLVIYSAFYEQISVYENIEVMQDESFELDLTRYQSNAVVLYLKARIAEDQGDLEKHEYYMSKFKKQIGKAEGARKRGPYVVSGHWYIK